MEDDPKALDNICGVLAKLIIANNNSVELQTVWPVFERNLPLRQNFNENKWVFKSFVLLYTQVLQEPNDFASIIIDHMIYLGLLVLHHQQYEEDGNYDIFYSNNS